ncbi:hypothetical protein AVL50_15710 [Flammeovirga sp. SJP92]|nr:hypothetical protein AVL50_15710 [Flammeovirga sp. SJP92]
MLICKLLITFYRFPLKINCLNVRSFYQKAKISEQQLLPLNLLKVISLLETVGHRNKLNEQNGYEF